MAPTEDRKRVTVRFPPTAHQLVVEAAAREHLSLNDYVREAALMRAAWEIGTHHGRNVADLRDWTRSLNELRTTLLRDGRRIRDDEGPAEAGPSIKS